MNTIKTTFVVIVLLAVLYGVYVVLNKPEPAPAGAETPWATAVPKTPEISIGEPDPSTGLTPQSGAPSPAPLGDRASDPASDPSTSSVGQTSHLDELTPRGPRPDSSAGYTFTDEELRAYPRSDRLPAVAGDRDRDRGAADATADLGHDSAEMGGASSYQRSIDAARGRDAELYDAPQSSAPELDRNSGRSIGSSAFGQYWAVAQDQIRKGQFREALATLTFFYGSPDLTSQEQEKLVGLLDPLAGKVIYSTEHLLEPPYVPRRGESLREIAAAYDVPWELLKNINGIQEPSALAPGVELKVVRGPFRAEIDLETSQLTLFVSNLYAGRFDVEVHQRELVTDGKYLVHARREWPVYEDDGRKIEANHPDNPYGQWLLDLGGGVKLHSSSPSSATASLGCISMSPQDASDVYGILSESSRIEIRR